MLNISKNTSNTDKSFNRIINVGDFGIYHLNIKWLEYFFKSVTVEGSLFNIVLHFMLIFNTDVILWPHWKFAEAVSVLE